MFKSKFIQHVSPFYARASVPLLPAPSVSAVLRDGAITHHVQIKACFVKQIYVCKNVQSSVVIV